MSVLIETQSLTLTVADKLVCENVNLKIKSGEIWGILGPNGCGKTTFLHALCHLHSANSGNILLRDKILSSYSIKTIAQHIGILFQDIADTFSQTVFEFCLTGRYPHLKRFAAESNADQQQVLAALTQMELADKLEQLAHTLSGGERRRLCIATLLTQAPLVYLLDEPTNHLDIRHQIASLNHFKKLARDHAAAIVMTTHDINLAAHYCDKILMLYPHGKNVEGNAADILTSSHLEALYQHPMRSVSDGKTQFWLSAH